MERYARGIDRQDRVLLRSAYYDGAVDDHVGFVGEVDDFIDWALAYHGSQTRYQHYLLNHTADIDGDQAHAETYYLFVGTDREPANHLTVSGGRYVDRLERARRGVGPSSIASAWWSSSTNRNRCSPTKPSPWCPEPARPATTGPTPHTAGRSRRRARPPTSLTRYPPNRRVRLGRGFTTLKTEERGLFIPGASGTVSQRAA